MAISHLRAAALGVAATAAGTAAYADSSDPDLLFRVSTTFTS